MMWHFLSLSKFFNKIGNYFYHLHIKELKIKQKIDSGKPKKPYCKKCVLKYATAEKMKRKEKIIHATQGNRIRKITEFWLECIRCKAKTKKRYC